MFEFKGEPRSTVFLAGSFNGWDPAAIPMKEIGQTGVYRATVALPPGRHEYKFVVNGNWYADPAADDCTANPYGTLNSVLDVR